MTLNTSTATALLNALRLAREHGGAISALRALGIELDDAERFEGISSDFADVLAGRTSGEELGEALALGFLAGRVAPPKGVPAFNDTTTFLMSADLHVENAEGESILRLPWFEEGLFVGRQLPDIGEIPQPVRDLAVENYLTALTGERRQFAFASYGLAYTVEAVPVRSDDGRIEAVLAIARPAFSSAGIRRATGR
ncbi:MAG TPA: hypothetical protein VF257_14865 [Solirubrobacteraceae bacterium]